MKWYLRPLPVILLIFLVLGPFGLPLLYKSPAFNKPAKITLTLLTLAYTAFLTMLTFESIKRVSGYVDSLLPLLK